MAQERERSSLDDETPGSQGEIEAGSEGDFTGEPMEDETPEPRVDKAETQGEQP